jgi:hypothetical protein
MSKPLHYVFMKEFVAEVRRLDTESRVVLAVGADEISETMSKKDRIVAKVDLDGTIFGLKVGFEKNWEGWGIVNKYDLGGQVGVNIDGMHSHDEVKAAAIDAARLFIDLAYRRLAVVMYVSTITADKKEAVCTSYYMKTGRGYEILTTRFAGFWHIDEQTQLRYKDMSSNEVVIVDSMADGEPFPSTINTLRSTDMAQHTDIDLNATIDDLSAIQPINRRIQLDIHSM